VRAPALAFLGFLSLVGCGDVTPDDPLRGTIWDTQLNATDVLLVSFHTDGTYNEGTVFNLTSGQIGADVERGTYTVRGDQLTAKPTSASCPTHSHVAETSTFQIVGSNLTLNNAMGAVILEKTATDTSSSSGGTVTYGCSDNDRFTPHEIVPL